MEALIVQIILPVLPLMILKKKAFSGKVCLTENANLDKFRQDELPL
jgi:hypothetical protein